MIRELKGSTEIDITEVRCYVDWTDLSRDTDQCCGHVNAVMTAGCIQGNEFRVPQKDCLSQEGLCYLELVSLWEVHTPSILSQPRVKLSANAACQTSYSSAVV